MNRRAALKMTAHVMGGTIVGATFFLSSCKNPSTSTGMISPDDIAMLDEIGETILPESILSPGAKAARIGEFMKAIVEDCYTTEEAQTFMDGIIKINDLSRNTYKKRFVDLNAQQRADMLTIVDKESRSWKNDKEEHFFMMMKQLTVWGYFTSQPGATQALRYNPIPGRYEACIPYTPGESAWS